MCGQCVELQQKLDYEPQFGPRLLSDCEGTKLRLVYHRFVTSAKQTAGVNSGVLLDQQGNAPCYSLATCEECLESDLLQVICFCAGKCTVPWVRFRMTELCAFGTYVYGSPVSGVIVSDLLIR